MKSKYLERIKEAYKQFELYTRHGHAKNGEYIILMRNANQNYDICEVIANGRNFADTVFDGWRENAQFFKSANQKGRYIVIMMLKQDEKYYLVNDYRI